MKAFIRKFTPEFLINFYHFVLAVLACFWHGFPSRKLKVIGITGTDGKSSVVELVTQILLSSGYKVGSVSSIQFRIGDKTWLNKLKMTMPGRFKLQKLLRKMVKVGCQYAVLEVTSEGIKQYRHRGIDFDVAVLTNLSPEHIESHGSFKKYREAKSKLFRRCKGIHVINLDGKNARYFLGFEADKKYGYRIRNQPVLRSSTATEDGELGIKNQEFKHLKIIEAKDIQIKESYSLFIIHNSLFKIPLLGQFNAYNALAAICVGLSLGIDLETVKIALEKVRGIPGRMELIDEGQKFTVIVDYAHTPAALEKVYQTIQDTRLKIQDTRLIAVLGAAGGGRDRWKRSVLGRIAAKHCDEIIITTEDPYDEEPMKIINEIAKGVSRGKVCKISDRRKAIHKALLIAKKDDIVIITGKGCEPWMMVNNKKILWDDRRVVREELGKLGARE